MSMKKPLYVRIGLFAVPTRKVAKYYYYFCLWVALSSFIVGLIADIKYFSGITLLGAAFWYEASIRWMDNNNAWEDKSE